MALKRIRYEDEDEIFRIEGGAEFSLAQNGDLVLPLESIADVGVAYFTSTMKRYEEYYGGKRRVDLCLARSRRWL